MKNLKTYHFTVHSSHFVDPVYIERQVDTRKTTFEDVLDLVAIDATTKWLKEYPSFFEEITAPEFYRTISILVSKEASDV